MNGPILSSIPDTLLFVIPSIGILLITMFRLDELFSAPRHRYSARRPMCGVDANGDPILCDPDGRRVPPPARSHSVSRPRSILINR